MAHWIEGFGTSPYAVCHGKRNCSGARIQPRYGSFDWYEALTGALQGMAFVHRLGFAHRDLKNQNVLYDIDSGRAKVLQGVRYVCLTLSEQVADFGMTKQLEQGASHIPRTSSPRETTPKARMSSVFGTGQIHST